MAPELFKETITALREQNDIDVKKAKELSVIYGSDINPNDNRALTNIVFKHLQKSFMEENMHRIDYFCYAQDFGRKNGTTIDDLWEELVKNMDVVGEIDISSQKPYPYGD